MVGVKISRFRPYQSIYIASKSKMADIYCIIPNFLAYEVFKVRLRFNQVRNPNIKY